MATTFTEEKLKEIMSPLLQLSLNKVNCNRYFPRKLVYGTSKARGLGLENPFTLQLLFHLQAILKHNHRDTPTWDLLQENLELVQWHVGSSVLF